MKNVVRNVIRFGEGETGAVDVRSSDAGCAEGFCDGAGKDAD